MSRQGRVVILALGILGMVFVGFVGCGAEGTGEPNPPPADGGVDAGVDGGSQCVSDQDCGPGLVCQGGRCVSPPDGGTQTDAGPPEDEHLQFQPPVGSEHFVFVVNTTLGTVAKIDPGSLTNITVGSIPVGVKPTILITLPGSDNAVVLNEGSRSISVIEGSDSADRVTEVSVGQPYTSMAMSPSGRYVVTFFDQSDTWTDPSHSASKIAIVDIASVLAGEPRVFEFAVGYRVTNAIFDHLNGPHGPFATRLLMVSKSEIAVVDLQALETTWILERLWVDNPDAQVVEAREVLATPDASMLFFRNFNTSELTVVEVESGLSTRLRLHGIPTDVDLSPDGSTLLAVQRAESIVTRVDLAADLSRVVEVDGVRYFDPDGDGVPTAGELPHLVAEGPVGQAELYVTPDGRLSAVLYTNVDRAEEISLMRVDTMQLTNLGHLINKLVDYVVVSPVASTAMVVHRPDYASTDPDPVEREIDSLHGYTLVDLPTLATFQQVIEAPVGPLSFSSTGRFAILTVFNQALEVNELHVVDLLRLTLRMDTVPLEALPQFVGVLPFREIAYVAQEHAYGKITFVDMESMAKRAVTGYELNAD